MQFLLVILDIEILKIKKLIKTEITRLFNKENL